MTLNVITYCNTFQMPFLHSCATIDNISTLARRAVPLRQLSLVLLNYTSLDIVIPDFMLCWQINSNLKTTVDKKPATISDSHKYNALQRPTTITKFQHNK